MTARVVIADDHRVFVQGLAALMAEEGLKVVGQVGDRDECMALIRSLQPEVAVIDVSMPGASISRILAEILEYSLPTRVLVLTGSDDPAPASELLAAGARGYLLKENAFADLARAIRLISDGGSYVDPQIAAALLIDAAVPAASSSLSARQLDVLRLVAAGHTSQRIANQLGLHVKTVDNHRQRIREKLGVKSAAEMIRVAKERGLI